MKNIKYFNEFLNENIKYSKCGFMNPEDLDDVG